MLADFRASCRCRGAARLGFTLVELLVVITIIGVLMSLLLPAVQQIREAARRMSCANNIKQLGLAILNYETTHQVFPFGIAYDGPHDGTQIPPGTSLTGKGWLVSVLPQLEQQALFDQMTPGFSGPMNSDEGMRSPQLRPFVKTVLPVFTCPSDGESERTSTEEFQWKGIEVAVTNYKGCIGDTRMGGAGVGSPDCHTHARCPGLFWRHSYIFTQRIATVRDGASSTFMLGEDVPFYNHHSGAYYANGDYSSCHMPLNFFPADANYWPETIAFRSLHPGGANFCMVDGSAHFIIEGVDHNLYRALSTKHGEEIAQLPD